MSKLKSSNFNDNIYIEFRFEDSLRKYEKQPSKKRKYEKQIQCSQCMKRSRKLQLTPGTNPRVNNHLNSNKSLMNWRGQQQSFPRNISQLQAKKISSTGQSSLMEDNHLQNKIYESINQEPEKYSYSSNNSIQSKPSAMEEEIHLNDFEQSPLENSEPSHQLVHQCQNYFQNQDVQHSQNSCFDFGNIKIIMSLKSMHQLIKLQTITSNVEEKQIVNEMVDEFHEKMEEEKTNKSQETQMKRVENQQGKENMSNEQMISYEDGGRIKIKIQKIECFISLRVINKLKNKCKTYEQIWKEIVHQRPYLAGVKDQFLKWMSESMNEQITRLI